MGLEIMSNICCDKTPSIVGGVSTMTAMVSRCPRNRWNRSARMRNRQIDGPRSLNWYQRTVEAMKLLLDGPTPSAAASGPLQFHTQFGSHGYVLYVTEEHSKYLGDLNSSVAPVPDVFDSVMLQRWTTINELLIVHRGVHSPNVLESQFGGLALLAVFPLLEEIARRISRAWDEDGELSVDVPKEMGLYRVNSKGTRVPRVLSKGDRIVDLSHKLFVMKSVLHQDFQRSIESLDHRMSRPMIEGTQPEHVSFFERLEYFRNRWVHGRKFEGSDTLPWLVTHFIALLYFRLHPIAAVSSPEIDACPNSSA